MKERFLEGRTALVTGSVQGLGRAIGTALVSAGARIAVHGLATREQADAAVCETHGAGAPDARFFDTNMRKPAAIETLMVSINEASMGSTGGKLTGWNKSRLLIEPMRETM